VIEIRNLNPAEARNHLGTLADILVDCVEGGASVSFMAPFTRAQAEAFFRKVIAAVEAGDRTLFAAFDGPAMVGTVQLIINMPPNQPHRAEVAKLLVLRTARGKGIGAALMAALEQHAGAAGKTLLMLDTVTGGDAERLYLRLNWTKAAVIPDFALFPDGRWCDTTILWKRLA
jgi:GNAT superfamily N-acetyltransferase